MVESAEGTNAGLEHSIHHALVMVETFLVRRADAVRLNARPRDGEAIALLVEAFQQGNVLLVEVVVIAGDVAGVAAFDVAGSMRIAIPDGFAFAVFVPSAFDLIGGRRHAPEKVFGKTGRFDV